MILNLVADPETIETNLETEYKRHIPCRQAQRVSDISHYSCPNRLRIMPSSCIIRTSFSARYLENSALKDTILIYTYIPFQVTHKCVRRLL